MIAIQKLGLIIVQLNIPTKRTRKNIMEAATTFKRNKYKYKKHQNKIPNIAPKTLLLFNNKEGNGWTILE